MALAKYGWMVHGAGVTCFELRSGIILEVRVKEHHSKVNFRKLVQDLADMYNDATFDVVLTELVANALDAKASEISTNWDAERRILVVVDDGNGMDPDAFEQYHDFAAEIKARGDGIGFAGVGAKISFNIADRVVTETRCNEIENASDWKWYDDGSLRWIPIPSHHLKANGTRVEVRFILLSHFRTLIPNI